MRVSSSVSRISRPPLRRPLLSLLAAVGLCLLAMPAWADDDFFGEDWPRTEGYEEVGYFCGSCHSLAIVKQQGLSRPHWDELFDWMIEDQGMAELEPEQRELYLDYLARHFNEDHRPQ